MDTLADNMVPKVHPLDREMFPEDPMELMTNVVNGDPALMLRCMIDEYLWMGWSREDLLSLFRNDEFPVLKQLYDHFGEARVMAEIDELIASMAGVRVTAVVDETPDPDLIEADDDMGLIQLSLRRREHSEGLLS